MLELKQYLLPVMFAFGMLASPMISAAVCSNVFPKDATPTSAAKLDLSVMNGQSYAVFPSDGAVYTSSADKFYQSGKLDNGEVISVTPGKPVRIFINGNLNLAPHTLINPNGDAADLLIVVRGDLSIGTKNDINALIYVTGDAEANPNASIEGALTAEGAIDTKVKDVIVYDEVAAQRFAFGDLCTAEETSPLYLRFDEPRWGVPKNTGMGGFNIQAYGSASTEGIDPALAIDHWGEGTCRYGEFDGGYIAIENGPSLSFTDELSTSFWLRVDTAPADTVTLIDKGGNYKLELNRNLELVLTARLEYFLDGLFGHAYLRVTSSAIKAQEWIHVGFDLALKADRRPGEWLSRRFIEGGVYVNGNESRGVSARIIAAAAAHDNQDFYIANSAFEGRIDELRLEQVIWSEDERSIQSQSRHWCGGTSVLDHFEFATSSGAHTCSPHTVTLKACTNAAPGECQLYPGEVSVDLISNGWVGGSNKVLANGIGVFQLQGLQLEMPLGVASSSPLPIRQTLCRIDSAPLSTECMLSFAQSGFIFDVPNIVANQGVQNIPISAVIDRGTEGSPKCEPAFIDESRNIKFWSEYVSPAGSELSVSTEQVWVNGRAVAQSFSEAEVRPLHFGNKGIATLQVNYREAGQVQLNAQYSGGSNEGDSGLMVGSDDFVSTPAGFCIKPEMTCIAGDSSCPAFRQVGETFTTTIRPVAWNRGADTCLGTTTRNYRQSNLELIPVLEQPVGGHSGELLKPISGSYDHMPPEIATGWDGIITKSVAFSEVGVFRLGVTPPPLGYFGATVPGSASAPIGRFYPTHLKISGVGALIPGCGIFSYQDQPIDVDVSPALTITAYGGPVGAGEYVTQNYDSDGFWRFASAPQPQWHAQPDELGIADRLSFESTMVETGENGFDGQRTYTWTGDEMLYARTALPTNDDLPLSIRQSFSAAQLTDTDGICYRMDGETQCQPFGIDLLNSEIRLGRLRISNAHGSELVPLELPWVIESWQAPGIFLPEAGDACSAPAWSVPDLIDPTGDLAEGMIPSVSTIKSGHRGVLTVAAPGVSGSGRVGFPDVPKWLWYDWHGEGREAGRGLATFGIYRGPEPIIFRREVYGQ